MAENSFSKADYEGKNLHSKPDYYCQHLRFQIQQTNLQLPFALLLDITCEIVTNEQVAHFESRGRSMSWWQSIFQNLFPESPMYAYVWAKLLTICILHHTIYIRTAFHSHMVFPPRPIHLSKPACNNMSSLKTSQIISECIFKFHGSHVFV